MNENAIRLRAYEIWEREGRPEGSEHSNWERATLELAAAGELAIKGVAKALQNAAKGKAAQPKTRARKSAAAKAA